MGLLLFSGFREEVRFRDPRATKGLGKLLMKGYAEGIMGSSFRRYDILYHLTPLKA